MPFSGCTMVMCIKGHLATAAPMVPEPTGVLRQSTAGLIRFMSTLSLYCTHAQESSDNAHAIAGSPILRPSQVYESEFGTRSVSGSAL